MNRPGFAASSFWRSRGTARVLVVLAVVAVGLSGIAAYWLWIARTTASQADVTSLLGATLPDVQGHPQALAQWRGKVLVVNFWATWCGPCREEMPDLVKLQAKYADHGLQLIGIAIDEPAPVSVYLRETPTNYPILIGGYAGTEYSRLAGNKSGGLPFTLVIDRYGRWAGSHLGRIRMQELQTTISSLF